MALAVGFDLGDTLIRYRDVPLNWRELYPPALSAVAAACGLNVGESGRAAAEAILLRYNTRVNPRVEEVTADRVFGEILTAWGESTHRAPVAAEAFFAFFRRESELYPMCCRYSNSCGHGRSPWGS